jgi:hypothetical protein
MTRPTVGKIAAELSTKAPYSRDPIELQREMHKQYMDEVLACIKEFRKQCIGDFYVVVLTKKERLMPNVYRNYFFARNSCPTPDYDQAVFKFHAQEEGLQFLWVIPSRDTSVLLLNNAMIVASEERELAKYVIDFANGTLFKLAKKLNGECEDSPLLDA